MTEIFPNDDTPMRRARRVCFVLFFKTFQLAEVLEKRPVGPT